jgi:general secretion pathway protein I
MRGSRQSGLTLVEVLVALAVLGVAAATLLTLISQNVRFIAAAEDRFLAQALADNIAVEELARTSARTRGATTDETTFAGRAWRTRLEISETAIDGLIRIDIEVRNQAGQSLATVSTLKRERRP